ncbi:MAG TPA: peptidase U32 family protein [Bacteroidales bacterium]|jgi:putative protease|nr:peptidase U32 family protein [Bacteroidales bacterium]
MVPVGSFESLAAAVRAGADSVYFGIGRFNMRSRSSVNFTADDLQKIMRICRSFNKKAYITLNVVFYDSDLDEMKRTVDLAKKYRVDAVIASDQSAIQYAKDAGIEVHLSTQVNISNTESLRFYSGFADVAVLARELNLNQVTEITSNIRRHQIKGPSGNLMKVELFAHGALCMAISGKCYLSLHNHNHSANRGECLQDCRRSYVVKDKETGFEMELDSDYIMSPKDLCTIHFINKIIDAGVRVLKIEGRARSPEYVKVVTECYDEALRSICDESYTEEKILEWKKRLASVFNRGFWDGYYMGQRLGEWSHTYGSRATKKKVYTAKCLNYFPKMGIAEFLCESGTLKTGDEVFITGPTTGVIEQSVNEIRVDFGSASEAKAGTRFSMPVDRKTRRADKLYRLTEKE